LRNFDSGATRDSDEEKYDYEGFLSPLVLKEFGRYMHKHRKQSDGKLRDSDNWQKGMPKETYIKSMFRHFMDLWLEHRGYESRDGKKDAICAIMFNSMGYLFMLLKEEEENNNHNNNHKDSTMEELLGVNKK
jgi:uncharacterized protein involved in tellurium resistance